MNRLDDTEDGVELLGKGAILGLPDGLLGDDGSVDMRLQICDHLLSASVIFHDLLLDLL